MRDVPLSSRLGGVAWSIWKREIASEEASELARRLAGLAEDAKAMERRLEALTC